jgi:hypothetical protein
VAVSHDSFSDERNPHERVVVGARLWTAATTRLGRGIVIVADVTVIVFRIIHILAGVAWAGSVFLFVVFVQPSTAAIAPAGAPFMAELLGRRRLVDRLLVFAALTIAGGAVLYWRDWDAVGSFGDWIGSSFGAVLTVGAVAAIAAFLIGLFGTRPNVQRLLAIGRQIAGADGPPSPELVAEMQRLQARLKVLAQTTLGLITIAVLAMATARYW